MVLKLTGFQIVVYCTFMAALNCSREGCLPDQTSPPKALLSKFTEVGSIPHSFLRTSFQESLKQLEKLGSNTHVGCFLRFTFVFCQG